MYSPVMYGGSQRKEVVTTLYPPVGVNRPPTADEWTQTKKNPLDFVTMIVCLFGAQMK